MAVNIYEKKTRWKFLLFLAAVLIGVLSLSYTNWLVKQLSAQEKEKVELWAEANRQLISSVSDDVNLNFIFSVIENNNTVPVILTDSAGNCFIQKPRYNQSREKKLSSKSTQTYGRTE
jgi:two-component system, sporulation sensor kinase D